MIAQRFPTAALVGLVPVVFGCASTGSRDIEPLPFHVAIIPAFVDPLPAGGVEAEDDATEFRLELESDAVSKAFSEHLNGYCFTRTSLLAPPQSGDGQVAAESEHWVAGARDLNADLLMEVQLEYDPLVYTSTNDKFWLNVPLFLLGGPMVWWVEDRSYFVEARLSVQLYDVPAMVQEASTYNLSNRNSHLMSVDVVHEEASFDFIDRADGIGDYALSILIPAGFVATDNEKVLSHLQQDIVAGLARRMVADLQSRQQQLLRPEQLVQFWPEDFNVVSTENGGRELRGQVVLRTDAEVKRMQGYRVAIEGANPIVGQLRNAKEEVRGGRTYMRYDVREPIPASAKKGALKLTLVDEFDFARTMTLSIDGGTGAAKPTEAVYRPGAKEVAKPSDA